MEAIIKSLHYKGSLLTGSAPVLSPTLERSSIIEFIPEPVKSVHDKFRILLDVYAVKQEELAITVSQEGIVNIRINQGRVKKPAGLWMKQNSNYMFELPPEFRSQELCVEWTDDDYLLIQPTLAAKSYPEETTLIPMRVRQLLTPIIEVNTLRNMFENIQDHVSQVLRYLCFESHKTFIESRSNIPSDVTSSLPQDICGLDEAHCRLTDVNCPKHVPKSGDQLDIEMKEVSDENNGRGTDEAFLKLFRRLKMEVSSLENNPNGDVVRKLLDNVGEENLLNILSKYTEVILFMLGVKDESNGQEKMDESNGQAIKSAPDEADEKGSLYFSPKRIKL